MQQLTAYGKFCYSMDDYWRPRLGGNVPAYVKQAVSDCLEKGIRNHSFTSFRSTKGKVTGPNAVQIGSSLYQPEYDRELHFVVAHEVAHQWFYQLIGSNAIERPWQDEALTQYATLLYFEDRFGEGEMQSRYKKYAVQSFLNYFLLGYDRQIGQRIALPISQFPDNIVYDALVYGKGAMMFHDIRTQIGDEAFRQALRTYYADCCFTNADEAALYHAFSEAAGKEMQPAFERWLHGDVSAPE